MKDEIKKLEQLKEKIIEKIDSIIKLKAEVINKVQELVLKYNSREISYFEYLNELEKNFKNKTAQELADYCDKCIEVCNCHLVDCDKKIRKEKRKSLLKKSLVLMGIFSFLVFLFIFFYIKGPILLLSPEENVYTQNLDLVITNDMDYNWELDNLGRVKSVKISGSLEGNGKFKIYLISNENELLILDSFNLKSEDKITGFSVEESDVDGEFGEEASEEVNLEEEVFETFEEEVVEEDINKEIEIPAQEEVSESSDDSIEPISEPEPEEEIKIKEFENYCEQTCDLTGFNLNGSSYILRIEIIDLILNLDSIVYEIFDEVEVNLTDINETDDEVEQNLTSLSVKENITEFNATEGVRQYKVVINRPVKWIKVVGENENLSNIELPKNAINISIKLDKEVLESLIEFEGYEEKIEKIDRKDFFSEVIGELVEGEIIEDIKEVANKKIIDLNDISIEKNASEIGIEYYTKGPVSYEENITRGKRVVISAPDELSYKEVLAFAEIPEIIEAGHEDLIKIYWEEEDEYLDFDVYDIDDDGKLDYVEWTVPYLSNQTFEISVNDFNNTNNVLNETVVLNKTNKILEKTDSVLSDADKNEIPESENSLQETTGTESLDKGFIKSIEDMITNQIMNIKSFLLNTFENIKDFFNID